MKYNLLLFISLVVSAFACAQEYEEVEFEVRKPQTKADATYFYRIAVDILSLPNRSYNSYAVANKHNDTVTYNRLTSIPISIGDSLPKIADSSNIEWKISWFYSKVSDTVFMHVFNDEEAHRFPLFCANKTLKTEPALPSLWQDYNSGVSQISIVANNVSLKVADRKYQCVKLQIVRRVSYGRTKTVAGEHTAGNKNGYQVFYCYLRSSDYLLVKAQYTERMQQFDRKTLYPAKTVFELYKAIE